MYCGNREGMGGFRFAAKKTMPPKKLCRCRVFFAAKTLPPKLCRLHYAVNVNYAPSFMPPTKRLPSPQKTLPPPLNTLNKRKLIQSLIKIIIFGPVGWNGLKIHCIFCLWLKKKKINPLVPGEQI